uniref:Uncharacterized protein n=1 Tax=Panagrolaimus sp. JU765 TaxID=591449 RepID=A0AC34R0L1_9BILA
MAQINNFSLILLILAFCALLASSIVLPPAEIVPESAEERQLAYMNFLNNKYRNMPLHLVRAARSNGKPTFIRFGKRSGYLEPTRLSNDQEFPLDLY